MQNVRISTTHTTSPIPFRLNLPTWTIPVPSLVQIISLVIVGLVCLPIAYLGVAGSGHRERWY